MSKRTTFFTVDRKLLESELWLSEPFSRAQAWLDLIGRASYEDSELTRRGQILISERELAKRWRWTREKVRWFLKYLEKNGMISRTKSQPRVQPNLQPTWGTTVTIEKYAFFQSPQPRQQPRVQPTEQPLYNNIQLNNISLNMPDGIEEKIKTRFGEKAEALIADVRRYYEGHPDRDFPGWEEAVATFAANQQRWATPARKRRKTIDEIIEEAIQND